MARSVKYSTTTIFVVCRYYQLNLSKLPSSIYSAYLSVCIAGMSASHRYTCIFLQSINKDYHAVSQVGYFYGDLYSHVCIPFQSPRATGKYSQNSRAAIHPVTTKHELRGGSNHNKGVKRIKQTKNRSYARKRRNLCLILVYDKNTDQSNAVGELGHQDGVPWQLFSISDWTFHTSNHVQ